MAKICSQKPPLAGGTLNICKSGTSKKALFWHISSILAMKGSQLWPLTHLKDKYYGKIELGKKIAKFGAPGTGIWLFKKKNMDLSIDCAVDPMLSPFLSEVFLVYTQTSDLTLFSSAPFCLLTPLLPLLLRQKLWLSYWRVLCWKWWLHWVDKYPKQCLNTTNNLLIEQTMNPIQTFYE